jgi:gliding motility-associated protein GldM
MASGNLSPRQKMINMMYLVLIALLALNVSKEILASFHLMEVSFNKAKENLDSKIDKQLSSLKEQASNDPTLRPYLARAEKASSLTNDFVAYIGGIIKDLEEKADGRKLDEVKEGEPAYTAPITTSDNIEEHAAYFFKDVENSNPTWRAEELEAKINGIRSDLLALLDTDTAEGVKIAKGKKAEIEAATNLYAVDDPEDKYPSWSHKYLEHSPVAAVITMLTKIQADAKSTEAMILDELGKGKATIVKVEELIPVVKTNKDVIMAGEKHTAEIFLAARTAGSENNTIMLNGEELENKGGKGYYEVTGSSPGTFTYKGVITVKTAEGDKNYNFEKEYQVFTGGASIAATKMNMMYIGVPNPISVSVAGANPSDVVVSASGGGAKVRKTKGTDYVVNVSQQTNDLTITASLKTPSGVKRMGVMKYRVRNLPKPQAKLGAYENGAVVPAQALSAQSIIRADMGQGFVYEGLKYSVSSFTVYYLPKGKPVKQQNVNGSAMPGGIKGALGKAKRGDRVIIDNIKAQGPTGQIRLQPVTITVS